MIFYRGMPAPLVCDFFKRGLKFGFNKFFTDQIRKRYPEGATMPGYCLFASGALTGVTETLFECPFENTKVRMQIMQAAGGQKHPVLVSDVMAAPAEARVYQNTLVCARQMFSEGVLAGYRGFSAHCARNVVWNSVFFGSKPIYAGWLERQFPADVVHDTDHKKFLKKFVAGALAGAGGTLLNTPFDVAKTRMQADPGNQRAGVATTMKAVVAKEGYAALWNGLSARVIRLGFGVSQPVHNPSFSFLMSTLHPNTHFLVLVLVLVLVLFLSLTHTLVHTHTTRAGGDYGAHYRDPQRKVECDGRMKPCRCFLHRRSIELTHYLRR